MSGYLEGLRVLDLSRLLPGPYAGMMLAEMGADVVKLENTGVGDFARTIAPMIDGVSALYATINRGKRNISVDLRNEQGKEIVRRLVKTYDVVIEGFRPGTLDAMGLGYDVLSSENPAVILCSITGYGQDGPYRDRAGHDLNYQSLTGVVEMTGNRGGPPGIPGTQVADLAGGSMAAVVAIMAAVFKRMRTGDGEHLDVAMCDTMLALQPFTMSEVQQGDNRPVRGDTILQGRYVCYNIYETKDGGYMSLASLEPKFFQAFCAAVNRDDLLGYHYAEAREGSEAFEKFKKLFKSQTTSWWVDLLKDVDACCEPVLNPRDIVDNAHFAKRDLFFKTGDEGKAMLRQVYANPALKRPVPPLASVAGLGEHSYEVLVQAGYGEDELREMMNANVIRCNGEGGEDSK